MATFCGVPEVIGRCERADVCTADARLLDAAIDFKIDLGYFGLLLLIGFLAVRLTARSVLSSWRARRLFRKVVIVRNGPLDREMVCKIEDHPEMPREIGGFLIPGRNPVLT